jgi:hypothetical protein
MTRNAENSARQAQNRAQQQLAEKIMGIADLAKRTRATGFTIPVVDDDPGSDSPTNIWGFGDGRLNFRSPDGLVHRFEEHVDPEPPEETRPPIPTFSTNPSVASGWKLWFHGGTGELRGRLANNDIVVYVPFTPESSSDGGVPPAPPAPKPPTTTVPKPPDPVIKKFRKVYGTTAVRMFCTKHGIEGGSEPNYGNLGSGYHGERRIMFHFNYGQIQSDLGGATIRKVELRMRNTYSWAYSGITIHFGTHNRTSPTATFSQNRRNVWKNSWPRSGWGGGSDRWRNTLTWFGRALRDGSIKGLTLDQPTGKTSYGAMDRDSLSLAITYSKEI